MPDDAFEIPDAERAAIEERLGAGAAVYGELSPEGANQLLAALKPGTKDVFCDLGSGGGALVLQVARRTDLETALGIEISATRDRVAKQRLLEEPDLAHRVQFHQGDLTQFDWSEVTLAFAGSLCFPDSLMRSMAHLASAAPKLRRLVTFKAIPPPLDAGFRHLGDLHLATTWGPRTRAQVLEPRQGRHQT